MELHTYVGKNAWVCIYICMHVLVYVDYSSTAVDSFLQFGSYICSRVHKNIGNCYFQSIYMVAVGTTDFIDVIFYICAYMYICMFRDVYMYISCMYTCMHMCVCNVSHSCLYVCICVCMYKGMHACIYEYERKISLPCKMVFVTPLCIDGICVQFQKLMA